ncbi:carbohydrate ABC transporter membrane protein 1, CUT1 family [Clostridium amylolyticum]|uniref:Carbohydrate ABC transporter membrane protein 1, CUT1 family n=1 Tax=Clostridium amylolyticum TaxID=1121298 RepID=A0A1M6GUY5_9CLOT|nr:sugar ABC transporter permease [Clostridium amylolyticum]SHJ13715.1 carbohydrate ABC transporter membrane protein 1, CUT1 family [Clostridium amylolyticum]
MRVRTISKKKSSNYFWAYLMIAPLVIGLSIFYIIPFFSNLFISFTNMGPFGTYKFIGIENYKKILVDPNFYLAFKNTFIYTLISVPITIILSIILAVLLNSDIKGLSIYRTVYFLPAITMPAAISMVWRWLLNSDFGLINFTLSKFGIQGPGWVTNPKIALYSVIIVGVWSKVGYNMIILLAGLQGISKAYYEAAEIDGAGTFKKFFSITIPLLTPTIFFVVIMTLIGSFQVFEYIFMMIPNNSVALESTQSVVYLFYKNAFMLGEKGYASAISIILFLVIMVFTFIQLKFQNKWVHYD